MDFGYFLYIYNKKLWNNLKSMLNYYQSTNCSTNCDNSGSVNVILAIWSLPKALGLNMMLLHD